MTALCSGKICTIFPEKGALNFWKACTIALEYSNKQKRNFALCLYHLNNKYSTSRIEEMFEFGEYVVKIEDELEFDKRIKNGAKENKYQLYSRDVLYYRDESIKDEMKIMDLMTNSLDDLSFIKRKEIFSYQNEYRYLIVDELEERK